MHPQEERAVETRNRVLYALIILFLILATNTFTCMMVSGRSGAPPAPPTEEQEPNVVEYTLLHRVIDLLTERSMHPVDPDKMLEGAVKGAVNSLGDPHTVFFNQKEMDEFLVQTLGSFGGIGVKIVETETGITVIEVMAGTPAEKAGMLRGDRICAVDGIDLAGEGVEKAVELLRGKEGTEVLIEISRPGSPDPRKVTLLRARIEMQTVFAKWLEPGMGYIKITQFDGRTGGEFVEQLEKMEKEGLDALVLDLRDNPGGLLSEAVAVARAVMPAGEITRIVGRDGEAREIIYSYASSPKPYPMAVLVNGETASGAEIVAAALQDHKLAILVGSTTIGKATVQSYNSFPGGGGMRYTVARYVTPLQKDIHGCGIVPDYEMDVPRAFKYYRYLYPKIMEKGSYGASVELLQEMLSIIGYDLNVSAVFDRDTEEAMKQFQRDRGLIDDGTFNEITWVELRKELDKVILKKDPHVLESVRLLKTGRGG